MWYVTATDKIWYNSKMVMVCTDLRTARVWYEKWSNRSDLKRVNIRATKPYYPNQQVSFYDGDNGGELMQSLRNEVVTSKIHKDMKRL